MGSLLLASGGGGVMLFDDVPAVTWSAGLNMLAVGLLGAVVAAVGAWLTRNVRAPVPSTVEIPRVVFVVRPERRELFESLRILLAGERDVDVILDRRHEPRDSFDQEVRRRGWGVARVAM